MIDKKSKAFYIVLSLLIGIMFWLYVDNAQGNQSEQNINNIPIEFIGETDVLPSRNLMLAEGGDTTIDMVVSGPRSVVTSLTKENLRIQVNLTSISAVGRYSLTYELLTPDNVNRSDITVEKASLSTVTVGIIQMHEKVVPVDVTVMGEIADGCIYMAEQLAVQPSSLTLTGREEDVDKVASALVILDLTGASNTVSKEFEYQLLDQEGNVVDRTDIRVSEKRVVINAPVYITKTLDLKVNPVESAGSMLENVDIKIDPQTIEVAGEAAALKNKDEILLGDLILKNYLSDTEMDMTIGLPAGCENLSGYNTTTVSVKFKDLETKAFSVTNISATGLAANQTFSRVTNVVDVVLRGPAEDLEQITEENIRIVVDLEDYSSKGTYSVPAIVMVDGFSDVGAVGNYSVKCKITN